ncbi:hypothetical protein BT96DRAFT_970074 [Gymnopus androsaceus JB14]|uniref:Uncharacterized protein n=1 Tax=Gymnopus androsaceus JB14 TaxID=1447944 RepID=A0A6A4IMV9_9AGAR|nr:hypothetical protein BT96DRAFT_970074 [Gymnopus androsaceus JB14]
MKIILKKEIPFDTKQDKNASTTGVSSPYYYCTPQRNMATYRVITPGEIGGFGNTTSTPNNTGGIHFNVELERILRIQAVVEDTFNPPPQYTSLSRIPSAEETLPEYRPPSRTHTAQMQNHAFTFRAPVRLTQLEMPSAQGSRNSLERSSHGVSAPVAHIDDQYDQFQAQTSRTRAQRRLLLEEYELELNEMEAQTEMMRFALEIRGLTDSEFNEHFREMQQAFAERQRRVDAVRSRYEESTRIARGTFL